SNLRLENEGGNRVSLNMLLNTFTYNAKWFKPLSAATEFVAGHEVQFQTNRNYGARVIVPDANSAEGSVSAYLKSNLRRFNIETGVSISDRKVETRATQNMDYTSGAIYPFQKSYVSANGNAGVSYNPVKAINIKVNASTGYRSPNLAELSSNGLHEGSFRYEIGSAALQAEQNLNTEVNLNYESGVLSIYTAAFVNRFRHFIYLAPTGTELYGFSIYRFLQGDARLYGGEAMVTVKPFKNVSISSQFATVTGRLKSDGYLPFIPADKWSSDVTFSKPHIGLQTDVTVRGGVVYAFAQNHPGAFETATPGYMLVNASALFIIHKKQKDIRLSLAAENLTNKRYYDHLSRFKYFGIYNTGRNVMLSLAVPFSKTHI
ncbi:MAG TPA: TonB-dependent receptor, partial [Chitinophagaceae bacterium]|nr:TonB-dependent receptor [Chitinophagaceae bacterium]